MRTKLLEELKFNFSHYSTLWEEWINYKYCHLTGKEIDTMNLIIKNNFKVGINDFIIFYNRIEIIADITQKLRAYYDEFKEWVISNWQLSIVKLASLDNINIFFGTDIEHLKISEELKNNLKKFGLRTLNDVFNTYMNNDFKRTKLFNTVLECQPLLRKEEFTALNNYSIIKYI